MGSTFEGWTQIMVFSMVFVVILSVIIIPKMNTLHSGNNNIVGLDTDSLESDFQSAQQTVDNKLKGGKVSFLGSVGLVIETSGDILISFLSMFLSFVAGSWILTIVGYIGLPYQIGWMLRGLYIIVLGIILLRILFKTRV